MVSKVKYLLSLRHWYLYGFLIPPVDVLSVEMSAVCEIIKSVTRRNRYLPEGHRVRGDVM